MALIADPDSMQAANPDDDLSVKDVIMKYQLDFTSYFGPKYAYGVAFVYYRSTEDSITVIARVQQIHQSTKGITTQFDVPMGKFNGWRKNVKLYKFMAVE